MGRVKLSEDLVPVSDFRIRTAEVVAKLKKNKRPVVLTQRGRSAAVLEDIGEYERRVERLELLEANSTILFVLGQLVLLLVISVQIFSFLIYL